MPRDKFLLLGKIMMLTEKNMCVCAQSLSCVQLLWPHGLYIAMLLCPWNLPGKNTGVGCHFLRQGIFMTWRLNLHLLHLLCWQADSLLLCHLGSPIYKFYIYIFFSIHIIIKYTRHWYVSGTWILLWLSFSFPLRVWFFSFLVFFSRGIGDLQCCVSFSYIAKWVIHISTLL